MNSPAQPRVFLLLGPPGSGKGTQAERLARHWNIPAISTGEMIRGEIKAGTELGRIAISVTTSGGLLSDDLVNRIVASRLSQPDCARGFMLDGYPRTVEQANYLAGLLPQLGFPLPTVVHIDVPADLLIARTCQRRSCTQCGAIYNLGSQPPKVDGVCDKCGAALQQRADDREDTVRNRLAAYEKSTAPLIEYYSTGDYHRVDGVGTPDTVLAAVLNTLGL